MRWPAFAALVISALLLAGCAEETGLRIPATTAAEGQLTTTSTTSGTSVEASVSEPEASHVGPAPSVTTTIDPRAGLAAFVGFDTGLVDGALTRLSVLVARTQEQREQGLMGVTDLAGWAGMWFVMDEPTAGGFWMKDTVMALSIAWIDSAGTVVAIADMEPCPGDPCPSYQPGLEYVAALEVPQGMLDDHGIGLGTILRLAGQ